MVRILVTGGTFDKEYDEVRGRLFFKDTHVQEMLDKVIAVCKKADVAAGITAGTKPDSDRQVARGATMILGIAQILIMNGSKDFLAKG